MRINEISIELDSLVTELLVPLRASKTLNMEALNKLNILLDELADLLSGAEMVPRKLTGSLWMIFTSMLTEAEYAKNRDEIEIQAWGVQDKLRKIFGPVF